MTRFCPHCHQRITPPADPAETARRYRQRLIERIGLEAYRERNRRQVARSRARRSA